MVWRRFALTLILMIGGGLMIRTFVALRGVPMGLDPKDVLTAQFEVAGATYVKPAPKRGQQDMRADSAGGSRLLPEADRKVVEKTPGVESVGADELDSVGQRRPRGTEIFSNASGVARPARSSGHFIRR